MASNTETYSALESKVWEAFDVIRNEVDVTSYHMITFLLLLKKEGLIYRMDHDKSVIDFHFFHVVEEYKGTYKEVLEKFVELYAYPIASLSDESFNKLDKWLTSFSADELKVHFPNLIEAIIYKLARVGGRESGEYLLPLEVSRFLSNIFYTKQYIIFNPFAGMASFGAHVHKEALYIGQEINPWVKTLGELRLLAQGRSSFLFKADSIKSLSSTKINPDSTKFDLIISDPPLNKRFKVVSPDGSEETQTAERLLITKGLELLKPDGKIITVVGNRFLSISGTEQQLRQDLVEKDFLEMVISLPGGILTNTGIPISVLVINKNKRKQGFVRFVNAYNHVHTTTQRERKFDDQSLLSILWSEEENESIRLVPNSSIQKHGYDLSVNRYFIKEFLGVSLEELITPIRGNRTFNNVRGKFIRVRDLRDDRIDYTINPFSIEATDLPRHAIQINESALLVAARWNALKPSYFEYKDEPIFISPDILAFKVKSEKVDTAYLISELHSDYVKKQLEAIRTGGTVPGIRKDDFLLIKIELLSLEEQIAKNKGAREALIQEKKKEVEFLQKIHGLENEMFEQNSFLRHSIAGPLKNMRGALKSIKSIIESQVLPKLPDAYTLKAGPNSELDFGRYLEILERDLLKVSENTRRNVLEESFIHDAPMESIELISFIDYYIQEVQSRDNLPFIISFDIDKEAFFDEETEVAETYISGNADLLRTLFNNIIENAEIHAFDKTKSEKNRVEFFLTFNPEDLTHTLLISNTGKPFPKNFDVNMFIRKGSKAGANSGDGFGGWYIHQIVEKHNGRLDIIDETGPEGLPDTDLVTSFEIILPIEINE